MTTTSRTGIALLIIGILLYVIPAVLQVTFDYPLLLVLGAAAVVVGVVLLLLGLRRKPTSQP
jgi:hypothetical protein